ncbi:MAG TPA: FAD-dependent oxidoreductase, partial [Casimicrobiaceae bacterium]|nr:FAD-dependent oxidoreductase [Casimicrobiaceae bacterium]
MEAVRSRRHALRALGAFAALPFVPTIALARARPRVVVIGAGYGGATAARYLALWGEGGVDVTLVERDAAFVSCPLSNLVLGGSRTLRDITVDYGRIARRVRVVHDSAIAVDAQRRRVRLARGDDLHYDRLILSPGIDFFF